MLHIICTISTWCLAKWIPTQDVVVVTIKLIRGPSSAHQFYEDEVFGANEQQLFTAAVAVAERQGKHVNLLVVPSIDVFQGVAHTAFQLEAA